MQIDVFLFPLLRGFCFDEFVFRGKINSNADPGLGLAGFY